MKKIKLTILLCMALFQQNICATNSFFESFMAQAVETIQNHPKYTIACTLFGWAASIGLTHHYMTKKHESDKKVSNLFKNNPALIFFTTDVSKQLEQTPLEKTHFTIKQEDDQSQFLVMNYVPDEENSENTSVNSYGFCYTDENFNQFPIVLQHHNATIYQEENVTLESMLAKAKKKGFNNGIEAGLKQAKEESTSGKIKRALKQ